MKIAVAIANVDMAADVANVAGAPSRWILRLTLASGKPIRGSLIGLIFGKRVPVAAVEAECGWGPA